MATEVYTRWRPQRPPFLGVQLPQPPQLGSLLPADCCGTPWELPEEYWEVGVGVPLPVLAAAPQSTSRM